MLCTNAAIIQDGESIALDVEWRDRNGDPDAPASVGYIIYDAMTEVVLGSLVTVPSPAASMSFVVPGSSLPAGTQKRRGLVIQIRGEFPGGEVVIESVRLWVERIPAFS